jgi:hypothetical protein
LVVDNSSLFWHNDGLATSWDNGKTLNFSKLRFLCAANGITLQRQTGWFGLAFCDINFGGFACGDRWRNFLRGLVLNRMVFVSQ